MFPILVYGCEHDPLREESVRNLLNSIIGNRNNFIITKIIKTTAETSIPGNNHLARLIRIDIVVEAQNGDICIIEIQLTYHRNIVSRILSYFGRHRSANMPKGDFDYRMPRYALIVIVDYDMPELKNEPYYHLYNTMTAENAPHIKLTEYLQLHLVSLHRFRELNIEPHDDLTTWLSYLSKDYSDEEKAKGLIEMNERLRGIEQAYREALEDTEVQRAREYELMAMQDYLYTIYDSRAEGKAEGMDIGIQISSAIMQGKPDAVIAVEFATPVERIRQIRATLGMLSADTIPD